MEKQNICPICGKPISGDKVYCSDECRIKAVKNIDICMIRICKECGKRFYSTGLSFCSAECRNKHNAVPEKKKKNNLDRTLLRCKRMGISYAEYQKRGSLKKSEEEIGDME